MTAISEGPVNDELAARFQAALEDFAGNDDFACVTRSASSGVLVSVTGVGSAA